MAEVKHPDLPGTPQEKAEAAKNAVALRPTQNCYVKIMAYCPIETDKSDAFLDAVDVFERACKTADVDAKITVSVTPPSEAQEKKAEDKRKAEEKAKADEKAKAEKK